MKSPMILKETCSGLERYEIQDEMLQNREIEFVGEVNAESVNSLIAQIRYLNRLDKEKEIIMYINSPGGEVQSGLALYDVMQAVKCPIHTFCIGTAASMGALLFASGDKRDILPHARVMIHDPLVMNGISGNALQIKGMSDDLMRIREITGQILAEHTNRTIDEIYEKTAVDSYFYADEAVKFGLADRVIDKL